ncbi:MAG: hypothetical protein KF754_07750 [Planctomycetes bacterium]|nr:hypothetical protein [Planctomycetota bacterium]
MNRVGLLRVVLASGFGAAAASLFEPWLAPVAALLLLLTLSPFARRRRIWFVGEVESEYAIVSRRREESLRAMKDLEEDRLAGKVSAREFELQRPQLLQAAKEATAALDIITARRQEARRKIEASLEKPGEA